MKIARLALVSIVAGVGAAACSTASSPGSVASSELTLVSPEFQVKPGDSFECVYTDTITDRELSVNSSYGLQAVGGHHIVVFYADQRRPAEHHPCVDGEMVNWHQVAGTAGHDKNAGEGVVGLPDGFAIKVPAGKQLVMQHHYINVTGTPYTAKDTVTLKLLEPSQIKGYANSFVMVDDQFKIPARAEHTRTSTCTLARDFSLLMLLGHMHEWGSHYKLERIDGAGNALENLYEHDWDPSYTSHPPTARFTPDAPLKLQKGMRLRQTCTWKNTSADAMTFPREMCVTYGFYWPDDGFFECAMDPMQTE